jgi:hypothetical protein
MGVCATMSSMRMLSSRSREASRKGETGANLSSLPNGLSSGPRPSPYKYQRLLLNLWYVRSSSPVYVHNTALSARSVTTKNALELLRDTMQDKNDRFRRPHAQRDGCSVVRLTESNS